eukprot:TRINITY_DN30116_c0_g1_i3.p1 TRINITY_DN30116_c0_g1~~TRINITY_DN30116_c0_g1_i3.p1  ORF type:complete len:122 (+),score=8.85 TRINITY_DN30116_c0_g1_i3:16-381(+)
MLQECGVVLLVSSSGVYVYTRGIVVVVFFFFKQKTAYEMQRGLVGSEMCIRDSHCSAHQSYQLEIILMKALFIASASVTLQCSPFTALAIFIRSSSSSVSHAKVINIILRPLDFTLSLIHL